MRNWGYIFREAHSVMGLDLIGSTECPQRLENILREEDLGEGLRKVCIC